MIAASSSLMMLPATFSLWLAGPLKAWVTLCLPSHCHASTTSRRLLTKATGTPEVGLAAAAADSGAESNRSRVEGAAPVTICVEDPVADSQRLGVVRSSF